MCLVIFRFGRAFAWVSCVCQFFHKSNGSRPILWSKAFLLFISPTFPLSLSLTHVLSLLPSPLLINNPVPITVCSCGLSLQLSIAVVVHQPYDPFFCSSYLIASASRSFDGFFVCPLPFLSLLSSPPSFSPSLSLFYISLFVFPCTPSAVSDT